MTDSSLNKAENSIPPQNNVRAVFRLFVIITWGIMFLPIHPMITYSSTTISVFQKYSTRYAIMLALYLVVLLLWPLLLGLPERYVERISQVIRKIRSNLWLHIQYIFACIFLSLLIILSIRLWAWGYNNLLRSSILLMGIWLASLPKFWDLGLRRWQTRPVAIFIRHRYNWLVQNRILWLQPVIAGSALLVIVTLAYNPYPLLFAAVLAMIVGLGGLLMLMRWPPLGLVAVILTFVIPFEGPSGVNATMLVVALLLGLWILDMVVRQRHISLVASKPLGPLFALILVAILAFGAGQIPWYTFVEPAPIAAQLGGLSLFVLSAGAFLLVAHQIREIKWLRWITWTFLVIGGIHVVLRLIPPLAPYNFRIFSRGGPGGSLFWTWLVALTVSQAVFNRKLHPVARTAIGGVALITIYVGMVVPEMQAWNSGWVPALTAAVVIVWAAKPRLGFVFLGVGLLGALTQLQKLVEFIMVGDNEYSLSTRLEAWGLVLDMSKINPILGLGPANYYYYTALFPIRGWSVEFNSHSQYIDLIAQTGILGLIAFLWFFLTVGWLGWKLRDRVPDGFARAYVYGAIGGVAGTLVSAAFGDWVIPFFYNVGLVAFTSSALSWLFLGGLVAVEQMVRQSEGLETTSGALT